MKTIYQTAGHLLASVFFIASLCCCNKNGHDSANSNLDAGVQQFESILSARLTDAPLSPSFEITEISRTAEHLSISVVGNASREDYEVLWDGRMAESHPIQLRVLVRINPEAARSSASAAYTITVKWQDLFSPLPVDEDYRITVLNGSKVNDKSIDENGNVSDL